MSELPPLPIADLSALDCREVWMAIAEAERHLAELKGICESLPNQSMLIDTLSIQEAKDSSEIENIELDRRRRARLNLSGGFPSLVWWNTR